MTTVKNSFKNMEIHSFLGLFPRFPVDALEDPEKLDSKFALEHEVLMRKRGQSCCKQKFPQTASNISLR